MNMMNNTNEIKRVSWRVDAHLDITALLVILQP